MQKKMASKDEIVVAPIDHSTPKQNQKAFGFVNLDSHERKSMQILQPSALNNKALVGIGLTLATPNRSNKPGDKLKIKASQGPVKVFIDNPVVQQKPAASKSDATQTDDSLLEDLLQERLQETNKTPVMRDRACPETGTTEDEAYQLMVNEPVPEKYWEEVAERRRLALSDTLEENKSLHEEISFLKEENEKLSELASQAAQLSALLQSVVSDDEDDDATNNYQEDPKKGVAGQDLGQVEIHSTSKDGDVSTAETQADEPEVELCILTRSGDQKSSELDHQRSETEHTNSEDTKG